VTYKSGGRCHRPQRRSASAYSALNEISLLTLVVPVKNWTTEFLLGALRKSKLLQDIEIGIAADERKTCRRSNMVRAYRLMYVRLIDIKALSITAQ
jgi:hypothetical protein